MEESFFLVSLSLSLSIPLESFSHRIHVTCMQYHCNQTVVFKWASKRLVSEHTMRYLGQLIRLQASWLARSLAHAPPPITTTTTTTTMNFTNTHNILNRMRKFTLCLSAIYILMYLTLSTQSWWRLVRLDELTSEATNIYHKYYIVCPGECFYMFNNNILCIVFCDSCCMQLMLQQ